MLNEADYFRKMSKKTGVNVSILEEIWGDCVKRQEMNSKESKSSSLFWKEVRQLFEKKVNEIDIMEARRIMNKRNAMNRSIEGLLDSLARDDYTSAQSNMRDSVKNCLQTMINSKARAYMKDKGAEVKERAKEV